MMPATYKIRQDLLSLAASGRVSPVRILSRILHRGINVLARENPEIRPVNRAGHPGGMLILNKEIPVIIVPDLHARRDFLMNVLNMATPSGDILSRLADGSLQLLCLGDGFHAERRGYKRWIRSLEEFQTGYRRHRNMDREMAESLGLMEMVLILKAEFPDTFHFLKGNHENIRNEEGNGNHPFGKFVYEGEMVRQWVLRFLGESFLEEYAAFEHMLPFMAVGPRFLASHAEPDRYYSPEEVIDIEFDDAMKLGLTWTGNDQSEPGTVQTFLMEYSRRHNRPLEYYFGGHRTISSLYKLRAEGYFIQIHNPDRKIIALNNPARALEIDRDIIDIEGKRSLEP